MKKIITVITLCLLSTFSFCATHAEELDKKEDEIIINEYQVNDTMNSRQHFFSFTNGHLYVTVEATGTVSKDLNRQIMSYSINPRAYISDGEGLTTKSCRLINYSFSNQGTYIMLSYTISCTGDETTKTTSGSFNLY